MTRVGTRLAMAVAGVAVIAAYLLVAVLVATGVVLLIPRGADLATLVVGVTTAALIMGYLSYRGGTRQVLAAVGARHVPRTEAPTLYDRVETLAARVGVEPPSIAAASMGAPNALALGGPGGVLVLDVDLVRLLDPQELDAIVAHELAHLARRDSLVKTLGQSLVGTFSGLLLLALVPVVLLAIGVRRGAALVAGRRPRPTSEAFALAYRRVASVVVVLLLGFTLALRAFSRRRELAADDVAAEVTSPRALASALVRIDRASTPPEGLLSSLYVHGNEEGTMTRLFATHPPMDERVERLLDRADEGRRRIEIQ